MKENKILIANWKMNLSLRGSFLLAQKIKKIFQGKFSLVLCPSFPVLFLVKKVIKGSKIILGAQNVAKEEKGAFTGEVSPLVLKEVGCRYVIIGHSERRKMGETDEEINKKIKISLKNDLSPIICLGEKLKERRTGKRKRIVSFQLRSALKGVSPKREIIIAYEPVWAIGTGKSENPKDTLEMQKIIFDILKNIYPQKVLKKYFHFIYGGSVNSKNIKDFLRYKEIEGALIGGASQKYNEFKKIIKITQNLCS